MRAVGELGYRLLSRMRWSRAAGSWRCCTGRRGRPRTRSRRRGRTVVRRRSSGRCGRRGRSTRSGGTRSWRCCAGLWCRRRWIRCCGPRIRRRGARIWGRCSGVVPLGVPLLLCVCTVPSLAIHGVLLPGAVVPGEGTRRLVRSSRSVLRIRRARRHTRNGTRTVVNSRARRNASRSLRARGGASRRRCSRCRASRRRRRSLRGARFSDVAILELTELRSSVWNFALPEAGRARALSHHKRGRS